MFPDGPERRGSRVGSLRWIFGVYAFVNEKQSRWGRREIHRQTLLHQFPAGAGLFTAILVFDLVLRAGFQPLKF